MPSSSPNSSLTGNSSGSETLVSRFSRRSNRDRHPARDPSDRSHTPLRCDRSRSPLRYDRRSRSRVTDGSEHERVERERREQSRERLEQIVQQDRERIEQLGDRLPPGGLEEPTKKQLKFTVARRRMKVFREWMKSSLSALEARILRDSFIPSFSNTRFDLVCPQVDSLFCRRFKDIKTPEMSKAEATERALKAEQYKILDVARPLLFFREKIAASADLKDSSLAEAAETALRLWGHMFHNVTVSRRENFLKVLDLKFIFFLRSPNVLSLECASLFGRHFTKSMLKEA